MAAGSLIAKGFGTFGDGDTITRLGFYSLAGATPINRVCLTGRVLLNRSISGLARGSIQLIGRIRSCGGS